MESDPPPTPRPPSPPPPPTPTPPPHTHTPRKGRVCARAHGACSALAGSTAAQSQARGSCRDPGGALTPLVAGADAHDRRKRAQARRRREISDGFTASEASRWLGGAALVETARRSGDRMDTERQRTSRLSAADGAAARFRRSTGPLSDRLTWRSSCAEAPAWRCGSGRDPERFFGCATLVIARGRATQGPDPPPRQSGWFLGADTRACWNGPRTAAARRLSPCAFGYGYGWNRCSLGVVGFGSGHLNVGPRGGFVMLDRSGSPSGLSPSHTTSLSRAAQRDGAPALSQRSSSSPPRALGVGASGGAARRRDLVGRWRRRSERRAALGPNGGNDGAREPILRLRALERRTLGPLSVSRRGLASA